MRVGVCETDQTLSPPPWDGICCSHTPLCSTENTTHVSSSSFYSHLSNIRLCDQDLEVNRQISSI